VNRIRRVVFDTSTLVSAALRIGSTPHLALLKALSSSDLCGSVETLAELEAVLSRRKFDRYLSRDERHAFVAHIRQNVDLFVVRDYDFARLVPPCRDRADQKFLALTLAAGADAIVSSDQDLLILHPWRGIPILKPVDYLSIAPADFT